MTRSAAAALMNQPISADSFKVRNSFADHVEDDLLDVYAMGRLCEPDLVYLEEHLLICHDCRTRLEAVDALKKAVRIVARRPGPCRAKGRARAARKACGSDVPARY